MATYSNALSVIRQYVSGAVGDLIYGQAGTTGATNTKTYAPFLWQASDYYNEMKFEVYVYAGTNIGLTRRVTDWDLTTFLLTVHSAYAAACDATSYVELHHKFSEDDYRKAINLAIESARTNYVVPLIDETTVKLASTTDNLSNIVYTYEYSLPSTMTHLYRVVKEKATAGIKLTGTVSAGTWTAGETVTQGTATGEFAYDGSTYIRLRKVSGTFTTTGGTATGGTSSETVSSITAVASEPAGMGVWYDSDEIDPRNWSIVKTYPSGTASLSLNQSYIGSLDEDLYLRLEGHMRQGTLTADTGVCYLPLDWIVQKAITYLPLDKIQSNQLERTYAMAEVWARTHEPRNNPNPRARKVME